MPMLVSLSRWSLVVVGFGLAACGGGSDGTPPTVPASGVARVALTVPGDSVVLGAPIRLAAETRAADGSRVTAPVRFLLLDSARAELRGDTLRAIAASGTVRVVAEAGAVADTVALRVAITPTMTLLVTGPGGVADGVDTASYTAVVRRNDVALPGIRARWRLTGPLVASADTLGAAQLRVLATASGAASVTAEVGALRVVLPVTAAPTPLASVSVTTATPRGRPGDSTRLTITARDLTGRTVASAALERVVDPATRAVVRGDWLVALDTGRVTLTVGRGTTRAVTTWGTVPASQFPIEFRQGVGPTLPARVTTLLPRIADRWREIVVRAEPLATFRSPTTSTCGLPPSSVISTTGVVVSVVLDSLDGRAGGVLAAAGPCVTRVNGTTAVIGIIQIDSLDVNRVSDLVLENVLMHEFGHVLGIGTLWQRPDRQAVLIDGTSTSPTPSFLGLRAQAAYGVLRGGAPQPVPLDVGLGHWERTRFLGEIMRFAVSGSERSPVSSVTVQALGDLGYGVASAGADVDPPALRSGAPAAISARVVRESEPAEPFDRILLPGTRSGLVVMPDRR